MIGSRLKDLRRARKLSQMELARRAGVSQSYLSRLENGALVNPATDVVRRIADALSVDMARLYAGADARSVVLRAELHGRVEQAVREGADDRAAQTALETFLESVDKDEHDALAEWGRRLVDSYLALSRLSAEESPAPQPGEEVSLPHDNVPVSVPSQLRSVVLRRDGLMPGMRRGDVVLFAPGLPPADGDLAVVDAGEGPCIRRVYLGPGADVMLVHPGRGGPPERTVRSQVQFRGRVAGTLFSS